MNKDEINGFNIFMGNSKCGTCHFAPLFNGSKPPHYYYNMSEVIVAPEKNVSTNSKLDTDEGKFIATQISIHKFAFKNDYPPQHCINFTLHVQGSFWHP